MGAGAPHPVQERILGIENVGGDIDKVTGRRCTFAFLPVELGAR